MCVLRPAPISDSALAVWCNEHLGSASVRRFFEASHLSSVVGVELADGRLVVVKVRNGSVRLAACAAVQQHLFEAGFPCAEVLAGPTPLGDRVATAEAYIAPGDALPRPPVAGPCARLLAALVERAPSPSAYPELRDVLPWASAGADGQLDSRPSRRSLLRERLDLGETSRSCGSSGRPLCERSG